jgi:hypothetical protein
MSLMPRRLELFDVFWNGNNSHRTSKNLSYSPWIVLAIIAWAQFQIQ